MNINRETKLYGSFAIEAGNKGNEFFNAAFEKYKINAIYKSFSVSNIREAFQAAQTLKMAGFVVAMPFKIKMYELLDMYKYPVMHCYGSVNTVIERKTWTGYNTDYIGVKKILKDRADNTNKLIIIGDGGLAQSVKTAAEHLKIETIVRLTKAESVILSNVQGATIYNCSPGDYSYLREKNNFIDCRLGTPEGDELYEIQSKEQFKLYTGIDYES